MDIKGFIISKNPRYKASNMSETKGGPYGDQTGAKFWQVICREHGYDPTVRHDDRTVKMRKVTKSDIEMMEKKSKQDKEDHSLNKRLKV
ncbi:hypothetical protein HID58_040783 [Brassica napus]|uniref:Uncharacterized protein n=2 Tax=Brassica napus TaxID=3708 RepID=A0ABQ8B917_BRANA|nr:hypothetical protein HID58_040783 [Brassica napus]